MKQKDRIIESLLKIISLLNIDPINKALKTSAPQYRHDEYEPDDSDYE